MRHAPVLALTLALACLEPSSPDSGGAPRRIVVSAPDLPFSALEALRVESRGGLREATRVERRVELTLNDSGQLLLVAPEACPRAVPARPTPQTSEREFVELVPLISLVGPGSDVGFDAHFEVSVRTGCGAARRGSLAWTLEGAPLARFSVLDGGYRVVGRTSEMPERLRAWPAGRIVPISPAERASTRLVARWTSPTGNMIERSFVIHAAPRSRGLPDVALGERVPLSGSGYRVVQRPAAAHADVMPWNRGAHPVSSIVPDAPGSWVLARAGDAALLRLNVARYDSVPLDCGRTECHAAEAHAAQTTPMTAALASLLDGPTAPAQAACAFGCHTTGEPGAADGGFSHALADHALEPSRLPSWDALPRTLRRLGGVGCLACHGPSQRPEESARWAVLRAEVCGYCHDAPPRYGHVRAWREGALSGSDERHDVRAQAECAPCHTTWGFLASLRPGADLRMPPSDEPPIGISCVACHAVHAAAAGTPGLLRRVPIPASYGELAESAVERSSACIRCHTPGPTGGASSALIWAGQGAEDPRSGAAVVGPAPHAAVPGGCVGCHGATRAGAQRGASHTFRADLTRCPACHAERPIERRLFERARHLLASGAAATTPGADPPHARPERPFTAQDRARALVRLVLDDRGAAVHNPRYAEMLLDRAASVLASDP